MSFPFFKMIQIPGKHGGIVIGNGGSYLDTLASKFGVKITNMPSEPERKRPTPYFLIEGYYEKLVNMASLRVYELIVKSMMQLNSKLISTISQMGHDSQHTNLVLVEKDDTIYELKKLLDEKNSGICTPIPKTLYSEHESDSEDNIVISNYA